MNHYFTYNPDIKLRSYVIDIYVCDIHFEVKTANNVFSYHKLDEGTRILLETIKDLPLKNTILDLGCGYGVIGLTVKLLDKARKVTCSDINHECIELTKENVKNLNLNIDVIESDGYQNIQKNFDTVIFNPPIAVGKEKIYEMYQDTLTHLNENGCLYLVIRKDKGALSHKEYLSTLFKEVEILNKKKGYYVLVAKK